MDKNEVIPEKIQDKDVTNKVPGFDAAKKVADEKITDVKEDLTEKVPPKHEKTDEKIEELIKK